MKSSIRLKSYFRGSVLADPIYATAVINDLVICWVVIVDYNMIRTANNLMKLDLIAAFDLATSYSMLCSNKLAKNSLKTFRYLLVVNYTLL